MSRNPTVLLLRGVLASNNDVDPITALFGPGTTSAEQREAAQMIARVAHADGLVEPTITPGGGPDGELLRIRVTPAGKQYLTEHEA